MDNEDNKPLNLDGCELVGSDSMLSRNPRLRLEMIAQWNKAVNRIRKYYGMPPLPGTNYD